MSDELVPPIPTDKGRVVRELAGGLDAVCFFGDDVGDIPALEALDELRAAGTVASTLKVVVRSLESSPALLDLADVVVDGPEGAVALMRKLLPATDRPASPAAPGR
jgi:trehalose 6-phosphate phosphatase